MALIVVFRCLLNCMCIYSEKKRTAFRITCFHQLIRFIKKTKHIKRYSVKSSTIYIRQLFLQSHFLFSKSTKFEATKIKKRARHVPKNIFFAAWTFGCFEFCRF